MTRLTAVDVHTGVRQRTAAASRNAPKLSCLARSVTRAVTCAPAWARVTSAEKLTCSAPTISARPASRSPAR